MNQCINYSGCREVLITRLGVERLAALSENIDCLNIKWKTCIIAPDDLIFGYGRMYQLLRDGANEDIEVARTLDAALRLMGVRPEAYPLREEGDKHVS